MASRNGLRPPGCLSRLHALHSGLWPKPASYSRQASLWSAKLLFFSSYSYNYLLFENGIAQSLSGFFEDHAIKAPGQIHIRKNLLKLSSLNTEHNTMRCGLFEMKLH